MLVFLYVMINIILAACSATMFFGNPKNRIDMSFLEGLEDYYPTE